MPRSWYDYHDIYNGVEESKRSFYKSIIADKKPYFMKYIYPPLAKKYRQYVDSANRSAIIMHGMSVDEMMDIPAGELSDDQREFIYYYNKIVPVGIGKCVMNDICRKFESEFDGCVSKHKSQHEFDYSIMKSNVDYSPNKKTAVKKVLSDYSDRLKELMKTTSKKKIDPDERKARISQLMDVCEMECAVACSDKQMLCDIVLDISYGVEKTKMIAWKICGDIIIQNLIRNNGNSYSIPVESDDGNIEFMDSTYEIQTFDMEEDI